MRGAVVTKAAVRAAGLLGVRQQELAAIIGVSPSTVSRMAAGSRILAPTEKAFELAVLFVRLFRSLDANVGGDHATAASWLRGHNTALDATPIALMQSVAGLVHVIDYLDARRAPL